MGIFFSSFNGLEPKIRFASFSENYIIHSIGDIFDERSERGSENLELLSVTMNDGVKKRTEIEGKDNSSENKGNYKIVRIGDMVYNSMRMWQGANGISPYEGIVSPAYTVLKASTPLCNKYIGYLFKNSELVNKFRKNSQGLTSDTWNLKYPQISTIKVNLPSLPEQEKIAAFLSLVDARIEKQRQLVEALKKYKRGLLSAIFDRKLEFSSSTWHSVALSECCNGFDNLRKPISSELREKGTIPYYGANGIQDYVKDYIFDGEYILLAEDGGHFDDFTNSSIAQYITGKSWVNNHAHILQAKPGYNNKYIYYTLVHKDIRKYINGTSRAKLNQEDMWQIKIITPDISTQNKIARFMSAIDEKISREEYNLFQLYKIKRGLLQQMFI